MSSRGTATTIPGRDGSAVSVKRRESGTRPKAACESARSSLDEASPGLEYYARDRDALAMPADYRLAFRELGLSIGLRALERTRGLAAQHPCTFDSVPSRGLRLERLMRYVPLVDAIEDFWLESRNREGKTWKEHEDINSVMLATSLAPEGYLLP
jgi:hypothetical protein